MTLLTFGYIPYVCKLIDRCILITFFVCRFTCQLAITEVNYPTGGDIQKALESSDPFQPTPEEPIVRNLNIGFAVDFETDRPNSIQSLRNLEGKMENMDLKEIQLQSQGQGRSVDINTDLQHLQASHIPCQQIFDTFEQCLHISNEMESVMAYYYKDENNSQCYNFQEIYNIDNVDMNIPSPRDSPEIVESKSLEDLASDKASWERYRRKPSLEQELDEHIRQEVFLVPNKSRTPSSSTESLTVMCAS